MKTKVATGVILSLIVAIAVIHRIRHTERQPPSQKSEVVERSSPVSIALPEGAPRETPSPPPVSPARTSTQSADSALPGRISASPGSPPEMIRKIVTPDFTMHSVLTSAGAAIENSDQPSLDVLKHRYGLTDDEYNSVVRHGQEALRADRQFQDDLQREVCQNSFTDLNALGQVLNEFDKKTEENQESLGRQSKDALGQELYSKIFNEILRQPPQSLTVVDFPVLLAASNRDLATEIDRFCGKFADQDSTE